MVLIDLQHHLEKKFKINFDSLDISDYESNEEEKNGTDEECNISEEEKKNEHKTNDNETSQNNDKNGKIRVIFGMMNL